MSASGASAVAPLRGRESGGDVPGSMEALIKKLHPLYTDRVRPLEEMYNFDVFRPSWYEETILNERPFITLFGPWSAGKTTFINYLLQNNYLWTGPQPTTAEFTVVMYGKEPGPIDGQALANSKELPFKGLLEFGESFINNLKGFQAPHPLLERVTLIDTPGVLESAKDIHQRNYDYVKVCRWFAERSDLIFVLFDPSKLDAGAELRQLFHTSFKGIENRLRLVLNKADTVSTQELMRVYGSLFWNLSNFISTTEPPRVYVGSFWDQPYNPNSFALLFAEEKVDLLHELLEVIPQQAKDKKVASLIRRAKEVLVHALIIGGIRSDLPSVFGKAKAKKKAAEQLPKRYELIGARYKMNHRDFPPVKAYQSFLERFDVEKFPPLQKPEKAGMIRGIQELIDTTLPGMLRPVRSTRAANPFCEEERTGLLNMYRDHVRSQYGGRAGVQGSTDIVSSTVRQGLRNASVPASSPASPLGPSTAGAAPSVSPSFTDTPSLVAAASPAATTAAAAASAPGPTDMHAMMAMMQQMMAAQQQQQPPPQQQQQPDRWSSHEPATVWSRGTPSPLPPPPPPPAHLAESSVPPTPQEVDSDNDLGPPTVVPPSGPPAAQAGEVTSNWVGGDVSKPLQ
ncbi:Sarcalumenin [Novymonas esmeraldas]|uniref:Sarcalumenin n=1 Tax=Novymonas esmeraldas TaxID=1808958 RepID=A0AAW0ES47_9TRYP